MRHDRAAAPLRLCVIAALPLAAFAVQVTTLPRPTPSVLLAVQVDRWLVRHRVVDSSVMTGGRHLSATCIGSWVGPVPLVPRRVRASLLVTNTRESLLGAHGEILRGTVRLRDVDATGAYDTVELAGCPWWLGRMLGSLLQRGAPIAVDPASMSGRRAYRVRVATGRAALELFVAQKS